MTNLNNKQNNVILSINNDDIIFTINDKKVSLLKLVKRLDSKMDKITYGGVLALVVGTVMAVPLFLTNKAFDKVELQNKEIATQSKEIATQSKEIAAQNKEIAAQNKEMVDYIIQLKVDQAVLTEKVRNLESTK